VDHVSHALPTKPADRGDPPEDWVPVERRWLGLDRRSLPAGITVAVIAILFTAVLPFLNDSISWNNPIVAGDRIALGPQAVVTPPLGWQLVNGVRVGEQTTAGAAAVLTDAGVTMNLAVEALPDGVDMLLTTITGDISRSAQGTGLRADSTAVHLTTAGGLTAAVQRWSSPSTSGVVAVIADPPADGSGSPTAVVIQASGPGSALDTVIADVDRTIRGVTRGGNR